MCVCIQIWNVYIYTFRSLYVWIYICKINGVQVVLNSMRKKLMKFLILVVLKNWRLEVLLRISYESSSRGGKYSYRTCLKFCKQSSSLILWGFLDSPKDPAWTPSEYPLPRFWGPASTIQPNLCWQLGWLWESSVAVPGGLESAMLLKEEPSCSEWALWTLFLSQGLGQFLPRGKPSLQTLLRMFLRW